MVKKRVLTNPDRVLVSIARASSWSSKRIPYEEAVIQAWRDWPGSYSLRNHPEYPDASDMHRTITDLRRSGLVVALGNKMFRLTDAGVEKARAIELELLNGSKPSPTQSRLGREEQSFLRHARSTRAFTTWGDGRADMLIDYDARFFFQFSTGTSLEERKTRRAFALDTLTKARALEIDGASGLLELAEYLSERFSSLFEPSQQ